MITVGSLFAGIGGFDLGFERVGFTIKWQVEKDKYCLQLLTAKWPEVKKFEDVKDSFPEAVDIICGGDPCPSRSLAKGGRPSRHPDLAGYFLALVARLRPRWVVRENVPAPDALHFAAALELLGYGIATFALDARDFTSQSRRRQIIIGCTRIKTAKLRKVLFNIADGFGFSPSSSEETTPIAACITAHPMRMAAEDSYCYEGRRGLRVLTPEECESLQGFPRGWTAGFSFSRRRMMLGNAIPVPFAKFIGKLIKEV